MPSQPITPGGLHEQAPRRLPDATARGTAGVVARQNEGMSQGWAGVGGLVKLEGTWQSGRRTAQKVITRSCKCRRMSLHLQEQHQRMTGAESTRAKRLLMYMQSSLNPELATA